MSWTSSLMRHTYSSRAGASLAFYAQTQNLSGGQKWHCKASRPNHYKSHIRQRALTWNRNIMLLMYIRCQTGNLKIFGEHLCELLRRWWALAVTDWPRNDLRWATKNKSWANGKWWAPPMDSPDIVALRKHPKRTEEKFSAILIHGIVAAVWMKRHATRNRQNYMHAHSLDYDIGRNACHASNHDWKHSTSWPNWQAWRNTK